MSNSIKNEEVGIAVIPMEMIHPWDKNPRKHFDEKQMQELSKSIAEVGVLEPILVRKMPINHPEYKEGHYLIVAGERRYKASIMAEEKVINCMIRDLDEKEALEIAIIENLQRSEVHPLDEAEGFSMLEKEGYTTFDLATKFGIDESTVLKRIKLLDLLPEFKKMFYTGKIKIGHALIICRLSAVYQKECLRYLNEEEQYKEFPGINALKDFIESDIQMSLKKVSFDINDANLVKGCPACTNCPKRSGANKLLFDDIEKDDVCLDRKCFDKKSNAKIEAGYQEAIKENMPIVAGYDYQVDNEELQENFPGVLLYRSWNKGSKSEGGIKAFCVSGSDKGKFIYIEAKKNAAALKENPLLVPVATQIANIKMRLERAKELDAEKIHAAAIEKARKVKFPAVPDLKADTFFGKIFILFLYESGRSADEFISKDMMGRKQSHYHFYGDEDKLGAAIMKDPGKLNDTLFNIFIQDLVERYGSAKGPKLNKFIMHQIFTQYDELIGYSKIQAEWKEKADKREKRAAERIKKLNELKKQEKKKPAATPAGEKKKKGIKTLVAPTEM